MRGNDTVMLSTSFVSRSDWPEDRLSARVEKKNFGERSERAERELIEILFILLMWPIMI